MQALYPTAAASVMVALLSIGNILKVEIYSPKELVVTYVHTSYPEQLFYSGYPP